MIMSGKCHKPIVSYSSITFTACMNRGHADGAGQERLAKDQNLLIKLATLKWAPFENRSFRGRTELIRTDPFAWKGKFGRTLRTTRNPEGSAKQACSAPGAQGWGRRYSDEECQ